MGLAAAAAAAGIAAAGTSIGSTIANDASGGPSSSGGFSAPGSPNLGTGLGDLFGALAPVGNELSGLGVPQSAFQPVQGFNLSTPNFGLNLTDNGGTLGSSLTEAPNPFQESLPGLFSSFGDIASGAQSAGQQFLENVTGGQGGQSPLLAPLNDIENARQKAISDVEGNLSERGLSGSSFANNAMTGIDSTFGQAASDAALKLSQGIFGNELQTLNTQGQAIQQQESLANSELAREIQQLQLEGSLSGNVSDALTRNSSTLAQLAAAASAGRAHAIANAGFNLGPALSGAAGLAGGAISGLGSLLGLTGDQVESLEQAQQDPNSAFFQGSTTEADGTNTLTLPEAGPFFDQVPMDFGAGGGGDGP